VKYVKRNALADLEFASFTALETHLAEWMVIADHRIHGTTHETPIARFDREERRTLRPLPVRALPRREQRLRRRVAHDALVDIDTVRYSVPHRLIRDHVEVLIEDQTVRIFHGATLVATHRRTSEPFTRVIDPVHFAGLWRPHSTARATDVGLESMGRTLAEYETVVSGGAQ
jgi:hypothetical protein